MEDESGIAPDPRIGGLVDARYKILEAMASGSMGIVYKAERVPVGKLVAIKFLHAPFANDAEFLGRFERETRVMSKLAHPNCVSVVDFGVFEGSPYLVMEYVSGTTLRALIDHGALPPKRALALVRQITAGLAHAHAQGIVHRDVKPANIMISEEIGTGDHVRILDFGLARLRGAVGRDATQSNIVVGTPNYMAPEQTVGGGMIDARTDIYAVGVVLFEMICGDRPFQADDTLALLGMHRAAPIPRLADHVARDVQLPPGLQEVVDKAMAKSPGDRFQSAMELADAIDEVANALLMGQGDTGELAIRRSGPARRMATAPTMLEVSARTDLVASPSRARAKPRGNFLGSLMFLVIVLGGAAAAVWWVKLRPPDTKAGSTASSDAKPDGPTQGDTKPDITTTPGSNAGSARVASGSAGASDVGASAGTGAGTGSSPTPASSGNTAAASGTGSGQASASGLDAGEPPADASVAGLGSAGGAEHADAATEVAASGSAADNEMNPEAAGYLAPAKGSADNDDDDEAANAPKTTEEAEKHAPAPPATATTLPAALQLIKEGKREQAIASLTALWKKTPNSSSIPFLLGNLYFDQRWWSVALEHYTVAIKKNADYRANQILNHNVIRMLGSPKTSRMAQGFLKYNVGKFALPYLKYAAQHDPNSQIKRLAGWLAKNI
jgi:serine/threonine-protein kinase